MVTDGLLGRGEALDDGVDNLRHGTVQLLLQRLCQLPSSSRRSSSPLHHPFSVPFLLLPAVHVLLDVSVYQGLLSEEGSGPVQEQTRVQLGQVVVAAPASVSVPLLQAVGADAVLGQVAVLLSFSPPVGLSALSALSALLLLLRLRVVDLVELLLELTQLFLNNRGERVLKKASFEP